MKLKIDIRIKTMLWLNDKIEKNNKFYKKIKKKKLEIQIIKIKLENIIFDKLGFNDKIENK
jgi:hypothetical protein